MKREMVLLVAGATLFACGGDDSTSDTGTPVDSGSDIGDLDTGAPTDSGGDTGILDTGMSTDSGGDAIVDAGNDADAGDAAGDAGDAGFVCVANALANGTFDTDVSGWVAAFPTVNVVAHDPLDAAGSSSSGSLRARSMRPLNQRAPVGQCVTVAAGVNVALRARAFIPATDANGEVQLTLNFYAEADCGGAFVTTQSSPRQSSEGEWLTLELSATAPATAVSMQVMLDGLRTSGAELTAHWDDVCAMTP